MQARTLHMYMENNVGLTYAYNTVTFLEEHCYALLCMKYG